jgi:putative ABC transport system permease protein
LSSIGGIIGIVAGVGVAYAASQSSGWPFVIEATVIASTVILAALIGVVAGTYPAIRASRLNPVEALRT